MKRTIEVWQRDAVFKNKNAAQQASLAQGSAEASYQGLFSGFYMGSESRTHNPMYRQSERQENCKNRTVQFLQPRPPYGLSSHVHRVSARPPATGLRLQGPSGQHTALGTRRTPASSEEDASATSTLQTGTLRHSTQGHVPPTAEPECSPASLALDPVTEWDTVRAGGPSTDHGQLFTGGGLKAEGLSRLVIARLI